ncbi:hypothetical protein RPYSC3_24030 [Rhodopseudomonas palustris]|nr:hypothetical protein RPYSC3_24030 [Rhodopseudomonas palustris]
MAVSIHAPARGATCRPAACRSRSRGFDPRSRAGSDSASAGNDPRRRCFDPRSRAGSDLAGSDSLAPFGVSIHAPARGATFRRLIASSTMICFDPRSRAGSDARRTDRPLQAYAFRSTLPRGERPVSAVELAPLPHVSIHAPARGATNTPTITAGSTSRFDPRSRAGSDGTVGHIRSRSGRFDPRSRAGSDVGIRGHLASPNLFRSTLPRGERPAALRSRAAMRRFDPRSRAGSDAAPGRTGRADRGFDPRSRAGSDDLHPLQRREPHVSIHAPARGATTDVTWTPRHEMVSIHAPARGATVVI